MALFMIAAMSCSLSASTVSQLNVMVVNIATLRPAVADPFITGLRFLPSFVLIFAFWIVLARYRDQGFLGNPVLSKAYVWIAGHRFDFECVRILLICDLRVEYLGSRPDSNIGFIVDYFQRDSRPSPFIDKPFAHRGLKLHFRGFEKSRAEIAFPLRNMRNPLRDFAFPTGFAKQMGKLLLPCAALGIQTHGMSSKKLQYFFGFERYITEGDA